jgi:hypothetical protein
LRLPLNPERAVATTDTDFLQKTMLNEEIWQKLIAGG